MKFFALLLALLLACITPAQAIDQNTLEQVMVLANRGNAEAQYHVGMLYNNGIGGASKDPKLAFDWFLKSATGKDPLGAYKLGCYYAGQFPGAAPLDPQQALDYKLFSAEAGYALAQYDVANTYYRKADHAQAGKWWKLAAQQGFAPSAFNLSKWYHDGNVEARDLAMTYAWFKISQLLSRGKLTDTAQASLDTIAAQMSSEQVQTAEKFVSDWRPTPTALTLAARDAPGRIEALLKATN
ncbi:MAG: tetratricopeptide repeat protein [Rhodoferax sp.]|uniref:tetratricopeptide repeat protein n=1 Tax=Rhodoferax sp. TaxID=50421 RepID=UPI0026276EEA|nr:tetratricopeptide repeat protein [Rhodoferax sp.]MDD5335557.1 tetratricopeptide repeat protein [Rhodoferax sp.]